jgi:hypothetical protein
MKTVIYLTKFINIFPHIFTSNSSSITNFTLHFSLKLKEKENRIDGLYILHNDFLGRIQWRQVVWGVGLQFIFGLLILRWSIGREIFSCLGHKVTNNVRLPNSFFRIFVFSATKNFQM